MDKNNIGDGEEFCCSDCGKEIKPEDEICPHCGAKFDNKSRKLSDDNLKRFDQFSREFYFEIINRHPEWDKYAFVDFQMGEPLITIEIPAPIPGVPPIEIISESDDYEEITIYFGIAHYHMGIYLRNRKRTLMNQLDGIDEITEMIFNEELIAVQQNPGLFFVTEGMVTLDQYKKLLDEGMLRRAVSWKGTYNFPKDGTHIEWNPKLRT